ITGRGPSNGNALAVLGVRLQSRLQFTDVRGGPCTSTKRALAAHIDVHGQQPGCWRGLLIRWFRVRPPGAPPRGPLFGEPLRAEQRAPYVIFVTFAGADVPVFARRAGWAALGPRRR